MTQTKATKKPSARGTGTKAGTRTTTARSSSTKSAAKGASLEDLSALAASNKQLEDAERASSGGNNSFITLVQGNSGILLSDDPKYIKGVKLHDYVITSKKLRLGPVLDATILGLFKLYEERAKKHSEKDMAPTVGFWMPEDAVQFPTADGDNFARQLPNGNVLMPTHWVFIYLHNHPEIEDGLISFRSVGNKVYNELAKLIKAESSICTELRWKIGKQAIRNEKYNTTNYYPAFTVSGKNFRFDGEKLIPEKGANIGEIKEILERSKKLHDSYTTMKLVGRKNLERLLGTATARPALQALSGYEEDEEEETQF